MAVVERSTEINISPEDFEKAVTFRPQDWPTWFVGVEACKPDTRYPQIGGTIDLTYKASGATFHFTHTLIELQPVKKAVYKMEGMMTGTQTWTIAPSAQGTHVNVVFDYQMAGGGLGKIADKLIIERMNIKNLEQSLENLKQMLEA